MISLKKTENKKWGVYVNGQLSANIILNKRNSIRLYKDMIAKLSAFDSPRYDIEIQNVQDGIKYTVWKTNSDDKVVEATIWFVDYDEVV